MEQKHRRAETKKMQESASVHRPCCRSEQEPAEIFLLITHSKQAKLNSNGEGVDDDASTTETTHPSQCNFVHH